MMDKDIIKELRRWKDDPVCFKALEAIEKRDEEIKRLSEIVSLWLDCALFLEIPFKHSKRDSFRKARRATYEEEIRRAQNATGS